MSSERNIDSRLREAFGRLDGISLDGAECPSAERLVASSRGELERAEREEVFLHITRCPACATAWRAARELTADREVSKRRILPRPWIGLAAAAVVLVVVAGAGLIWLYPDRETVPVYRTQQQNWLQSMLDEGRPLPRENFLLRWSPGPEGTRYDIQVLSTKLEPLTAEIGLTGPEYHVPEESLEGIPSGSRILWQVTAWLPDGRRIESETFINEVD